MEDVRDTVQSTNRSTYDPAVVTPLVVGQDEITWRAIGARSTFNGSQKRRYYFWFFGHVAKLPYERKVEGPAEPFGIWTDVPYEDAVDAP